MDMLSLVFTISAIVGGGFLVWLYTKPGKKLHCAKSILRTSILFSTFI